MNKSRGKSYLLLNPVILLKCSDARFQTADHNSYLGIQGLANKHTEMHLLFFDIHLCILPFDLTTVSAKNNFIYIYIYILHMFA